MRKNSSIIALALLTVLASYADTSDEIRDQIKYHNVLQSELDKRTKVSGPKKSRLKMTAKDGSVHYVDSVEGPSEYISVKDYIEANNVAKKKVEDEKKMDEQRRRQYLTENQPKLKAHAEKMLLSLDFDVKRNIYIDKRLVGQAASINLEVKHFAWQPLQRACRAKDWLNALNIIYNILHKRSDMSVHYDLFPVESEIDKLYSDLTNYVFRIQWSIASDIDIVAFGNDILDVVGSLDDPGLDIGVVRPHIIEQGSGPIFVEGVQMGGKSSDIPILSEAKIYLGYKNGPKYGPRHDEMLSTRLMFNHINDSDYVIPGIVSIAKERSSIAARLNSGDISQNEYKRIDSELCAKYKDAFKKIFVKFPDETAIAQDNKRRQEQVKKDDEDRRRRYPIEQKKRAEYAKAMLSKLSFDVSSYFDIQNDLKRFVYSIAVTEKNWGVLKDLQARGDWLGMLNAMSGSQMKDFPVQTQIEAAIENLKKNEFHAEFLFTHTDDKRNSGLHHKMCVGEISPEDQYKPIRWDQGNFSRDVVWVLDKASLIVPFSINGGKNKFIHSEYPDPSGWELLKKRHEQLNKISSDAKLGRITQSEAEKRRKIAEDELMKGFSAWLNTSRVRDSHYPVRVREQRKNVSVGQSSNVQMSGVSNSPSKPQWVTCPDCNGSRYISKGKCPNCDGVGRYRTSITQGIGGRPMGGRMTQCDKCNGKGEIKESCKTCRGRGKVKQ